MLGVVWNFFPILSSKNPLKMSKFIDIQVNSTLFIYWQTPLEYSFTNDYIKSEKPFDLQWYYN
jgi:hypothetical protein